MAKAEYTDRPESDDQVRLAVDLAESDKQEEREWRLKTDLAAYGRKRIVPPDRW